ncbi:DNA/RNA non-specific endonuclease [uncultured Shewanella sp.]|uniref:DNA/RNA non-specific endonuclease n=1 Tax=uncultured Shewanella sp. TaxID=173975 RepID=UPI0026287391|nr:DNA/RNA non-specific endonuclease [uncultured Shewanella sp.]
MHYLCRSLFIFVLLYASGCSDNGEQSQCVTKYRSETSFISTLIEQEIQYTQELVSDKSLLCHPNLFLGTPYDSDQLLCREGFALGYNYTDKIADWTAYKLTPESVTASFPRTDVFTIDSEVPTYAQSAPNDYQNTDLDRGHLAPAATIDFSELSVTESFYMSNIVPQHLSLNRGLWANLEQWVRDCTVEVEELFVYTGVINSSKDEVIGDGVHVPESMYKVIIKPRSPAQSIAFLIPNIDPGEAQLSEYITDLNSIEKLTGANFLQNVRDDIASQLRFMTSEICEIDSYDGRIENFETVTVETPYEDCSGTNSSQSSQCCKVCSVGKACGDTCINSSYSCSVPSGCACNQ